MNGNVFRKTAFGLLIFLFSGGLAYAAGGSGHPGDNPFIVGGSFGLLFTFFAWIVASGVASSPDGNYMAIRILSGLSLGLVFLLCAAMLADKNLESGFKSFVAFGYICFSIPQAALIFFARKSALSSRVGYEKKTSSDVNFSTDSVGTEKQPVNYTEEQTKKLISDYLAGIPIEEMAAELGKSVRSVVAKLSREGVWISGSGDRAPKSQEEYKKDEVPVMVDGPKSRAADFGSRRSRPFNRPKRAAPGKTKEDGFGSPPHSPGEATGGVQRNSADQGPLALMAAALAGNHDRVKSLLARGSDPLSPDERGIPSFLAPAFEDDAAMQRTFLSAGVSPDLSSEAGGVTALMLAAARGSRELCDLLLDAGADINKQMGSGEPFFTHPRGVDFDLPALGCAIDGKHWDLAGHLLERGAKPQFGVMHTDIALTLAKFAPVALIAKLNDTGYLIVMDHRFMLLFAPPPENQLHEMRSKIVFWAAANPDPEVLPWVLAHGGDPMVGNTLGMTPLIVAAAAGNAPLVAQLLAAGADASAEDCDGDTALSLAVERGHAAAVKALRRHPRALAGDVNPPGLHQGAAHGELGAALAELDKGTSPNLPDSEGNTALMLAAKAGRVGTVRALYALGASLRPRNVRGQSAWDLADARVRVSLREFGAPGSKTHEDEERISPIEQIQGRYAHPFKNPSSNP